jgi:hypothetical protein
LFDCLKEKWPNKLDRMAFYDWLQNRTVDNHIGAFISRKVIIDRISTTNYNDSADRRKLSVLLTQSVIPCLPAGKDHRGNIYSITPDGYGLRPDRRCYPPGSLNDSVLSITFPQDSDDSGRFFFHQIGNLEVWCGGTRKFECNDSDSDDPEIYENIRDQNDESEGKGGFWRGTDYYIVMRIDERGASKGLYLIFNFYPEFEYDDGKRDTKIDIDDADDGWWRRMIKVDGRRVTVAKVADNVEQLKFTREFDLTEAFYDSVNLVTTIQTKEGTFEPTTDNRDDTDDTDDMDDTDDFEWS